MWGAAWLQKATKNPSYLNYIQVNGQILGAGEYDNTFGWDNKHVGARILLSKVPYFFKKYSSPDLVFKNCNLGFKNSWGLRFAGIFGPKSKSPP